MIRMVCIYKFQCLSGGLVSPRILYLGFPGLVSWTQQCLFLVNESLSVTSSQDGEDRKREGGKKCKNQSAIKSHEKYLFLFSLSLVSSIAHEYMKVFLISRTQWTLMLYCQAHVNSANPAIACLKDRQTEVAGSRKVWISSPSPTWAHFFWG